MFDSQYRRLQALAEGTLEQALPESEVECLAYGMPQALAAAMRYSLLAGGKRLRPVLLLASYGLLKPDVAAALPFAVGIEMIHSYSLIHDDLPAMDDDDLRRGKPSSHKAFGEAMAILAGDALLNVAFEQMLSSDHPRALQAMREIASRSGARGMIAGQAVDIAMQGQQPDAEKLAYIHQHKTADLITAAVCAGLALGAADERQMAQGRAYGLHLGLAFQIIDDVLDLVSSPEALGKQTQKDAAGGKLTWPGLYGVEQSVKAAEEQVALALEAAQALERGEGFLSALAERQLRRIPQHTVGGHKA